MKKQEMNFDETLKRILWKKKETNNTFDCTANKNQDEKSIFIHIVVTSHLVKH